MIRKALLSAAIVLAAGQANAASFTPTTYDFSAFAGGNLAFSFQFMDWDEDMLVSLDEVDQGTFATHSGALGTSVSLSGVPTVSDVSDGGFEYAFMSGTASAWRFATISGGQNIYRASNYTYEVSAFSAAVPLPATLPLAIAGLGALGLMRRRRAERA